MSLIHKLLVVSRKISSAVCLVVFVLFTVGNAHAVTIDFDDIDPFELNGDEGYLPLTNQYESLGVIFESSAYFSRQGKMLDGPGFGFRFVHELPTYVSMYVGSADQLKVGVSFYDLNGYIDTVVTDGWVRGMNEELSTPYRDNQFVSFYAPQGISYVHVASQQTAYMDNLSFSVNVPEPSSFLLLFLGILITYLHRKRPQ